MSEVLDLSAEARERAGKGASRAMRREGRVPAVIYGNKQEPVSVHVEEKVLMKLLHTGHFFNSVVMLDVAGKKIRTLPKDVQFHPVTDRPLHCDFLRIGEHSKVTVDVPVHFKDEELSPGMKKGGVLNIVVHDLGLTVDAAEIPEEIVVSLKGLDVGGTIHLSDIKLPKGATPVDDAGITIATLVAPSALKAEEAEAAEAAAAEAEAPAEEEAAEGETPAAEGESKIEDGAEG